MFSMFESSNGTLDRAGVDIHWTSSSKEMNLFFVVLYYQGVRVVYVLLAKLAGIHCMPNDFQKQ